MKVKIDSLIEGLKEIPTSDFSCDNVYHFLGNNPVEIESIEQYFFWSDKFYTRNLLYRDDRFELMAICWNKGQVSRVHDHAEQNCWMSVVAGKLRGQNFAVESIDESRGHCRLKETSMFNLSDCLTSKVELEEPIHQILNLADFNERAVSVHVYSKPIDRCVSYCRDTDTFKQVNLCYTSIRGELCDGIVL